MKQGKNTISLVTKRRRAADAIKQVAQHYGLGGLFDHQSFTGEDHERCIVVDAFEVRFTMIPGDIATQVVATVFLDDPDDGLATVVVQNAVDLVRRSRRAEFHPDELGIPWRHPRDKSPEINVTVSVINESEVSTLPPRKKRKTPQQRHRQPQVHGALDRTNS